MRNRSVRWLFWLAAVVLLQACHFSYATLSRTTHEGRPSTAAGVTVTRSGAPLALAGNLELQRGDIVETDARSTAVIQFASGSATLLPSTKVTVSSIWTWFGRVFFSGQVNNDTTYASTSVDGTEYLVEVSRDGGTVVTVLAGHVTVRAKAGQFPATGVSARMRLVAKPGSALKLENVSTQELYDIVREVNSAQGGLRTRLVPDVTRLESNAAQRTLQELGISSQVQRHPSAEEMVDKVFAQSPLPGERGPYVILSVGARGLTVPNLVGLSTEQAQRSLPSALRLGARSFETTGTQPLGRIARQNPPANRTVLNGTAVDIVIEALIVPELRGKSEQEARDTLERLGLKARVTTQPMAARQAGTVLDQQPQRGQRVEPGTLVHLTIASAPQLPPRLTISAKAVSFKPLLLGETARQELQLRNDGGAPLAVRSAKLPTGAREFDVEQLPATCSSLAPGASCSLTLGYRPAAAGEHHARLAITSNDPNGTLYVELSGTARPRKPDLQVSIQSVGPLKRTAEGRLEARATYLVSNTGGTASGYFKIDSDINGLYAGQAAVTAGLGPGQSQTVIATVGGSADAAGRFELQVTVDGCGGVEFAKPYCNVDEANEGNNTARSVLQVPP